MRALVRETLPFEQVRIYAINCYFIQYALMMVVMMMMVFWNSFTYCVYVLFARFFCAHTEMFITGLCELLFVGHRLYAVCTAVAGAIYC